MALGGTYQDHYKDMFKDVLLIEAQQMGSVLEQAVMIEPMEGNKTFFDKAGKVTHRVKSARNEDRVFASQTFERRQVQETLAEFATLFDREDLIKHVNNPKDTFTRQAVMELGRRKDNIIYDAIGGNAVVTTDGSTANQGLTLTVAVNDHTYDSGSGDVELTISKLKVGIKKLRENFGLVGNERVVCIGPSDQLMNLTTDDQAVSSDYRAIKPLEGPGVIPSLSGLLGIDFISYDLETDVDGSSDEYVYLLTEDAIKLGIFEPLKVEVTKNTNKAASPDQLAVWEAIGATRMYEEKVIGILCNPIA
jgi:hypothetical protein